MFLSYLTPTLLIADKPLPIKHNSVREDLKHVDCIGRQCRGTRFSRHSRQQLQVQRMHRQEYAGQLVRVNLSSVWRHDPNLSDQDDLADRMSNGKHPLVEVAPVLCPAQRNGTIAPLVTGNQIACRFPCLLGIQGSVRADPPIAPFRCSAPPTDDAR